MSKQTASVLCKKYRNTEKGKENQRIYLLKTSEKRKQYRENRNREFVGKLLYIWQMMRQRTKGKATKNPKLYKGLSICSLEEFLDWSLKNKEYESLYTQWKNSNYNRKLSPSVNRINTAKGYIISNIEWLTASENSRLGAIARNKNRVKT